MLQKRSSTKTRLEYKKFLLETRRESYGTVALLEKEMDLARVIQELNEVEVFITSVNERKAVLEAQALWGNLILKEKQVSYLLFLCP